MHNENVLAVLPTGGGKTVLFGGVINDHVGASCAIAHRSELVGQMSLALAKYGVPHRIVAPSNIIRWICQLQMAELGTCLYNPNAPCAVAGVDTLIRRPDELASWMAQVGLWVIDEAHHVIRANKWGKAVDLFPNAKGLGVTATPLRADGKGLGRHAQGVFDDMVVGPSGRDLINAGYLTDYKIFAPPSDLDLHDVAVSAATGDYNPKQLKLQVRKSRIMGDVVDHYLRLTPGQLGITFATDIETATEISARFRSAGVPSEVVSSKTPNKIRVEIVRRFRAGDIKELVNVDIFGEGFDLPALQVGSFARPSESYGLYSQQFGRILRIMKDKKFGTIIDHVGNVMRHGLPDVGREWTLDARERRPRGERDPDVIPTRTCIECTGLYEAIYNICPYCLEPWVPADRSSPEQVDGDLAELDPEVLAALRGEINRVDTPSTTIYERMAGKGDKVARGAAANQRKRQEAQAILRDSMKLWGGYQAHMGRPKPEGQKRFYFKFGVDVMRAQALGRPAAAELNARVVEDINKLQEAMV
jgi:superfamily II DNA or RNA helicase